MKVQGTLAKVSLVLFAVVLMGILQSASAYSGQIQTTYQWYPGAQYWLNAVMCSQTWICTPSGWVEFTEASWYGPYDPNIY
jgi:hypothetical protein